MEYDETELIDLAYTLIIADDETAAMIIESLSDQQLEHVLQLKTQIERNWSSYANR